MEHRLNLDILPQPDETTCGPTCLHAVYSYFNDEIALDRLIGEIPTLRDGGTLAVFLACHALRRGYRTKIFTYNLEMFDPSWFGEQDSDLRDRLSRQLVFKNSSRFKIATDAYMDYIELGGTLRFEDLTSALIRRYLKRGIPILTGLSATYLYHSTREHGPLYDDVRGIPSGHFVILAGYAAETRSVLIMDPLHPNPLAPGQIYEISIDRVLGAILLGVLTHDANLLIIEPREKPSPPRHVDIHSR